MSVCGTALLSCRHTDFVTALDFHPADDKFFLSGSIDGKASGYDLLAVWE